MISTSELPKTEREKPHRGRTSQHTPITLLCRRPAITLLKLMCKFTPTSLAVVLTEGCNTDAADVRCKRRCILEEEKHTQCCQNTEQELAVLAVDKEQPDLHGLRGHLRSSQRHAAVTLGCMHVSTFGGSLVDRRQAVWTQNICQDLAHRIYCTRTCM